jgi:fimbrial isopeptide formation D2 family protein/LPXTG-motif cell wall-anchored protein
MKKWISLVLALVLTLCMSTAWAAEVAPLSISPGDTGTIHVNGLKEDGLAIHVYKIISVDFDVNAGNNKGYLWDTSVATWLNGKTSYNAYVGNGNKVTTTFTDLQTSDMSAFVNELSADIAVKNISITDLGSNARKHDTADPHYDVAGLEMGQYLILVSGGVKVYAPMVASVLPKFENGAFSIEDGSVTAKSSTPSLEKKVNDKDEDTSGDEDYLGKEIRFDIRADIPEYPANATNKTYTISDTMSKGLTYTPYTLEVYGVPETGAEVLLTAGDSNDYTLTGPTVGSEGITTFTAAFKYDQISSYKKVHITYKATLNVNAVIGGTEANPNKAELTYSNDPYGSTTHKIDDTVKVFTYGLKVHKQDGSNNNVALAGAEFKLYKITTVGGQETKNLISGDNPLVTGDDGLITIKNLDEGLYELQEVKAPDGYSPLEFPIRFTITGEKNGGTLTGNVDGGSGNGWETGYYETTIANYKQTGLPSTGGTGTTVFTVVGIVLIAGCVLAVILRKRKSEK